MSVDPTQPASPDPTPPNSPADPAAESTELPRMKRRFKRTGGPEEAEGEEKSDQTIELLSTLLQDLVSKKEQRPPPPETPAVPSKSTKYHRLSKTGSGNPAAPTEAAPPPVETPAASSLDAPVVPAPPSLPSAAPAPAAFRPAPTFDPDEARRLRVWKALALVGFLVGLTGLVLWYTHPGAGRSAPAKSAPVPAGAWTGANLRQLDEALAADRADDLKTAQRIASGITKPGETAPPGLTVYLAGLDTRQERNFDAEAELQRLPKTLSPETTAAVQAAMAFNFSRTREFDKAADAYQIAVQNDPFSASLLYDEAEVARRLGHLPEAAAGFRRALERIAVGRPEVTSLRDCIGLKLRLCLIEQGQETEFQAEMDEQLKASGPSGYWLLTAAAVALQHKDVASAADLLGKARSALGTEQFDALLNDYFFRAYADRKELAEFFPDSVTRRTKMLPSLVRTVDP